MTKEKTNKIFREIEAIADNFEDEPWTENVRLLKADFDAGNLEKPKHYSEVISEVTEILREARLLFLHSVFAKVCEKEGESYSFSVPYQAGMKYSAVMKKEGSFYLLDEDGDYREIFTNENFVRFIDDQYWQLIEE